MQLGHVIRDLPLTCHELRCELVHALAHRVDCPRKLLHLGQRGAGRGCGLRQGFCYRCHPPKLRPRAGNQISCCIAIRLPSQSGTDPCAKYDQGTGEPARSSRHNRRLSLPVERARHRVHARPSSSEVRRQLGWFWGNCRIWGNCCGIHNNTSTVLRLVLIYQAIFLWLEEGESRPRAEKPPSTTLTPGGLCAFHAAPTLVPSKGLGLQPGYAGLTYTV